MASVTRRRLGRRVIAVALATCPGLQAAAGAEPERQEGTLSLFDGKTLGGWRRTPFPGGGEVSVDPAFRGGPGAILVRAGQRLSGVNWTRDAPRTGYELSFECIKLDGSDFMCGLTFPVDESHATLILGGWGGPVVGISSVDGADASENPTTRYLDFDKNRWYRVRLQVTAAKLQAWLDAAKIVDLDLEGRKLSLRAGDMGLCVPIGLCTYKTSAAYRAIRLRRLKA